MIHVSFFDRLIALVYSLFTLPFWILSAIKSYISYGYIYRKKEYCCGFDYLFIKENKIARLFAVVQGKIHLVGISPKISYCSQNQNIGAFSARDIHHNLGIHPPEYNQISDDVELDIKWYEKYTLPILYIYSLIFKVKYKPTVQKISWFGIDVYNGCQKFALQWIMQLTNAKNKKDHPALVGYINADCLNQLKVNPSYRKQLSYFDLVLPDGVGVKLALLIKGISSGDNINGTDLSPKILEIAEKHKYAIYFLGGKPNIAQKAIQTFQYKYPDLQIAGSHDGYFEDNDALINEINQSGANLLFVGFGTPKQEQWVVENYKKLSVNTIICVGGMFDFYAGKVKRAPLFMRKIGFEWIYRLYQEPKRLCHRYLVGNSRFIYWNISDTIELKIFFLKMLYRLLDLIVASLALIIWIPFHFMICALFYFTTNQTAIFKQVRVGRYGQHFMMYKYRTMDNTVHLTEKDISQCMSNGIRYKNKSDPRITKIGYWLRKYSIDEIPQFWNVLKGDMSLVGPRPALKSEVLKYSQIHRLRLLVKPGMTGLWQISGRSELSFHKQLELDLDYIIRRSLINDILILIKTIPAVISTKGAI